MFRRSDLILDGMARAELDERCRNSIRLRRGIYARSDSDPEWIYSLRCKAALEYLQPGAALAGPTAAFWWQLPLPELPQQIILRGVPRGSYGWGTRVLNGPAFTTEHQGERTTVPAQIAIDCARLMNRRDALIIADALLHEGKCTSEDLESMIAMHPRTRGIRRARWVAANADGMAESPGETWARMTVRDLGYEVTSQVRIEDGGFVAVVDLLVEGGPVILEFDGALKYRSSTDATVVREKVREGRLEELGYRVLRVVWPQLNDPAALDRRLRAAGVKPSRRPLRITDTSR